MNIIPSIEGGARRKKRRSACVYLTKKQCRFPCQRVGNKCRTMFSKKRWKENKKMKVGTKKKPKIMLEAEYSLQPSNTPEPNEEYVPTVKDPVPESEDSYTSDTETVTETPVEEVAAAPEKEDVDTEAMPESTESAASTESAVSTESAADGTSTESAVSTEPAADADGTTSEPAVTEPEEPSADGNEKNAPSFLDGVSAAFGLAPAAEKKGGSKKKKRRKSSTLKKKSNRKNKKSTRKKRSTRKKS